MTRVKAAFLVLGLGALAYLIARIGPSSILASLRQLRWWQFILVCLPYAIIMLVDTLGWRFAFPHDRAPFFRLVGARLAGEALNVVTAVGSIGGEAVKAWLAARDVSHEESVASVVIAKTTNVIAQALFLMLGIVITWAVLDVDIDVIGGMLSMLGIEILAVAGFVGVQLFGVVGRGGRLLARFGVLEDASYAGKLDATLRGYYRREWRRFSLSVGFHFLGWILGVGEAITMLWALGVGPRPVVATVIESFGSGVRFATFFIPASVGAFEAANAAAFGALGIGAGVGLAFSLARRARQVVWICIGLVLLLVMRPTVARAAAPARRAA
jgi:glycosyltransferase 2 family protein